jgi:hypothetical protein
MARPRAKPFEPVTKPLLSAKRLEDLRKFGEELVAICGKYHFEMSGSDHGSIEIYDLKSDFAPLPPGFESVGYFANVDDAGFYKFLRGELRTYVNGIEPGEWFQDGANDPIWEGPKE